MTESSVVNWDDPDANMYGCYPCPKCESKFRYMVNNTVVIRCDECGHGEEVTKVIENGETTEEGLTTGDV